MKKVKWVRLCGCVRSSSDKCPDLLRHAYFEQVERKSTLTKKDKLGRYDALVRENGRVWAENVSLIKRIKKAFRLLGQLRMSEGMDVLDETIKLVDAK